MTALAAPETDPVVNLDAVPICELLRDRGGFKWEPCEREAVWRIHARKPECGHDTLDSVLVCDPCLQDVLDSVKPLQCQGCRMRVYIDRVERL